MFISENRKYTETYGPLCGELGQNILSRKGLSWGFYAQPVTMILYLFADRLHSRAMSFELTVTNEPCTVIVNPCLTQQNEVRHEEDHMVLKKDGNKISIQLGKGDMRRQIDPCYHMQHFIPTYSYTDKACIVGVMYLLLEKILQTTVNMYYDRYQAQRCSNCTKSYMKVFPLQNMNYKAFLMDSPTDDIISEKHEELSARAETVSYTGSAPHFVFISNMTASVMDDTFHITISPQTKQQCTKFNLGTLQHTPGLTIENNVHSITSWCASTTFQFKSGHHVIVLSMYANSKLSFRIKFQTPNACHSETHAPVLTMISRMGQGTGYIISWVVNESTLDWTIVNPSEEAKLLAVFISIVSKDRIGSGVQKALLWVPHGLIGYVAQKVPQLFGLQNYAQSKIFTVMMQRVLSQWFPEYLTDFSLYRSVECQELLQVHLQHDASPIQEHSTLKRDSVHYCIHSRCYYLHAMESSSWTDAFSFCNNLNQHLLAINSDFEARLVKNIINKHQSLSFSPVLFINLKKADKVCVGPIRSSGHSSPQPLW